MSRILGFVRDILIARFLGTGAEADAWVVAFRFPNLFRRLFAEGAFNAAFVPLFAKQLEENGEERARQFAQESLSVLLAALLLFTALAQMTMPYLMVVVAPGFLDDPEKYDLTVLFTRIAFPYLLFMSLVALFSGLLNALGRFAAAAAAPVILNVVLILALAVFRPLFPSPGHALVWGVVAAGALQFLMVVWAAHQAGMALRLPRPRLTPGVRRLLALGIPGVIAGGITQINILVGTMISTFEDGAASILYYADRVYQLPLGVIGIAIGVVLLPDLSRRLRAGDFVSADESQNRAFEFSMALTVPSAVALAVIPEPIVSVLFQHGAFAAEDAAKTALALQIFALGLPAFVLIKVFSPGFFAREDTLTPLYFAATGIIINIAASFFLFFQLELGYLGIAIATSVAGWVNGGLLGLRLWMLGYFAPDRRLLNRLPRILLAALVMGFALMLGQQQLTGLLQATLILQVIAVTVLVLGGMTAYAASSYLTGATTADDLKTAFRRRVPIQPNSENT